jgi:hypothetical protein
MRHSPKTPTAKEIFFEVIEKKAKGVALLGAESPIHERNEVGATEASERQFKSRCVSLFAFFGRCYNGNDIATAMSTAGKVRCEFS